MTIYQIGGEYWVAAIHSNGGLVRGIARDRAEAIKRCRQLFSGRVARA